MKVFDVEIKENEVYKVSFVNYETCEVDECVCTGKNIIGASKGISIGCASVNECINTVVADRPVKQTYFEFADIIDIEEYDLDLSVYLDEL